MSDDIRDILRAEKENFLYDGKLGDTVDCKILFICKSSNVFEKDNQAENIIENNNVFWMKGVVEARLNDTYYEKGGKALQTKYFNCLNLIAKQILGNCDDDIPKSCAYMNLNKRSRLKNTNITQIEKYIQKYYDDFISKEIKILNPEHIVLMGNIHNIKVNNKNLQNAIQQDMPNSKIWIYTRHPCQYRKDGNGIKKEDLELENI